jgi:lipopolysaccharide biosynthesis protein
VHYFPENYIPFYVKLYINELQKYFDEIVIVTNERTIKNVSDFADKSIKLICVTNEGYDLGMFYKGYLSLNVDKYDVIGCINDSNILFGKLDFLFDWATKQDVDFWGLISSDLRPPYSTHKNNFHIQSHFLVLNKNATGKLNSFFEQINFQKLFSEKDTKTLKRNVINDWEIGISQYLISNNLTCAAYVTHEEYQTKYGLKKPSNISLKLYGEIIKNGVPIIKKRIIMSTNLGHLLSFGRNWNKLIRKYGDENMDLKRLITELSIMRMNHFKKKVSNFFK